MFNHPVLAPPAPLGALPRTPVLPPLLRPRDAVRAHRPAAPVLLPGPEPPVGRAASPDYSPLSSPGSSPPLRPTAAAGRARPASRPGCSSDPLDANDWSIDPSPSPALLPHTRLRDGEGDDDPFTISLTTTTRPDLAAGPSPPPRAMTPAPPRRVANAGDPPLRARLLTPPSSSRTPSRPTTRPAGVVSCRRLSTPTPADSPSPLLNPFVALPTDFVFHIANLFAALYDDPDPRGHLCLPNYSRAPKLIRQATRGTAADYGIPAGPFALTLSWVLQFFRPGVPPIAYTSQPFFQAALTTALQYLAHTPGATPLLVAQFLHPFLLTAQFAARGPPEYTPPPLRPYLAALSVHPYPARPPDGAPSHFVPRDPHPFDHWPEPHIGLLYPTGVPGEQLRSRIVSSVSRASLRRRAPAGLCAPAPF
ncbi:hypothetical protein AB1Y20_013526 [Prymnesium parvum]|uniref:Uncharacterized protein n=1 Tax=Prymnesium parvum TaxID=97485 RepID=A0AB34IFS6_PRYPA